MKLLRSFPALAFTLVLVSIVGLCTAQESVGLLLVTGTLAAMSWYITEGPRGRTLPRWVSNVLVIAASLNVFRDLSLNTHDVMGVLGRFALFLTLIKLYERKSARDHAHLLSLSLLLMVTGCLQTAELAFGLVLLAYAALGLYVLLLYQLQASYEESRNTRQASTPADYRLVPPLKPIIGRTPGLHFRLLAVGIAVTGLALSMVFFVVFPRELGANMVSGINVPARRTVAGFASSINLLSSSRLMDSRAQVCTLRLLDERGSSVKLTEPLRLRGGVLEHYENGVWSANRVDGRSAIVLPGTSADLATAAAEPGAYTQEFTFIHPIKILFSLGTPRAGMAADQATINVDPVMQTLRVDEGIRRYEVVAHSQPSGLDVGKRFIDDIEGVRELTKATIPADLKRNSLAPATDWRYNSAVANAIEDYLHSRFFAYTTDLSDLPPLASGEDPIERFLFESRRGHCEYFASAMTAMCHSLRVPARIVVGYVAWKFDETEQEYVILDSNAHAWVEVQTGTNEWTTFDPTPPAALTSMHDSQEGLEDRARWTLQEIEANWSNGVVAFDSNAQSRLLGAFESRWSQRVSRVVEAVRDWMERVNQAFYLGPAGYIWMGIVAFALLIAVVALVRLMRRSLAIRRTLRLDHVRGREYQRMLRQLGFYLDMLKVLRRGGIPKPDWQPPLQYAHSVASRRPDAAGIVRQITEVFYAARYNQQSLTRDDITRMNTLVTRLASQLRVRV